jgi:serine/threonine protein phosphatase PrpC
MASVGASLFSARTPLSWRFAALTDVGRLRAHNEDAVAVDAVSGLALLADGMGGYKGGEVASAMAIEVLQTGFGRWFAQAGRPPAPGRVVRRALQAATDQANTAVLEASMAHLHLQGMGTTLVLAAFGPQRVVVGHIGDSRCYRLRAGRLDLLTRDHSLRQQQLDAGLITAEEAVLLPQRNLVTRALGVERSVVLEMHEHGARPGDLYLLCSDGLSEMLSDAQLLTLLGRQGTLAERAALLVASANDGGGRDNISVILARAGESDGEGRNESTIPQAAPG